MQRKPNIPTVLNKHLPARDEPADYDEFKAWFFTVGKAWNANNARMIVSMEKAMAPNSRSAGGD